MVFLLLFKLMYCLDSSAGVLCFSMNLGLEGVMFDITCIAKRVLMLWIIMGNM